ncbi:putative DNA polymerase III [Brevibacillus phage SecTim467]|uniref:Putative DNA polymerase III n=2 Tax=Jenstvirus jenst TaxID=1982225 RepID=A0A0K2CPD3_9CAUD|nr:DNA polymerase exonuclease subunit [Brevibacillus phage Jenst]ALA07198.1 putative DNA polymerase III [Brevibacillus phage Jenst]ALA07419.1 putative DNA polymerase III [Brevibacillus phage SecTim467]
MRPNYVIIDFETTGLDYDIEQVTEIAAIRVSPDFNVIGSYHAYVQLENGRSLSTLVKNLTGLTDEFLNRNGISEGHAIKGLWEFIYNNNDNELEPIVVSHHTPFDFGFLHNYGLYPHKFICTRVLSRLVEPNEKASLEDVAKRHGFYDAEGHHKATKDVEMTRKLLAKFIPIAEERNLSYRNHAIESTERPLKFIPAYATVTRY